MTENHFADKHLVDADGVERPRRLNDGPFADKHLVDADRVERTGRLSDGIVGTSTKRRVGETSVGQMFFDEKTWNQYGARKALFPLLRVPSD